MEGQIHPDDLAEATRERDRRVKINERTHVYTLDSATKFRCTASQVSGFYFKGFNPARVAAQIVERERMRTHGKSKYTDLVKSTGDDAEKAVRSEWTAKQKAGVSFHALLETRMKAEIAGDPPLPSDTADERAYLAWRKSRPGWRAVRAEWSVFSENLGIAGQIDAVFYDTDSQEYVIVDWKRVGGDIFRSFGGRGRGLLGKTRDCKAAKYSVQLNVYAEMLRLEYGVTPARLAIVQIVPDTGEFREHELPLMPRGVVQSLIQGAVCNAA